MSTMIKAVLFSLFIVFVISFALSTGIYFLTNFKVALGVFVLLSTIQILGGIYWNTQKEKKEDRSIQEIMEYIKSNADKIKVPIALTCAYCQKENFAPISLLEDNAFLCNDCKESNKVYIQYSTVRITKPLASKVELKEIDMEGGDGTQRQTTVNEPIKTGNA